MQVIADFLSLIGETIFAVIDWVISMVQDLLFIVQLAVQVVASVPGYFSWLPAPIAAMILTAITVIFIYKIAGR